MRRAKNITMALVAVVAFFALGRSAFAVQVGDEAPCVVLDGVNASGEKVRGCIRDQVKETQSFTIVEFFSILCSTCQKNLPLISQLSEDVQATTTVRLVSVDRDEEEIQSFLREKGDLIRFPVAFDLEGDAKRGYDVFKTPTLFVLNKDNEVLYRHSGLLKEEAIAKIKSLVKVAVDPDPEPDPDPIPSSGIRVGDIAPCVVLPGQNFKGKAVRGCIRKPIRENHTHTILEFFSIHCGACQRNLPRVSALNRLVRGKATVRIVSIDQDVAEVKQYLKKRKALIRFPVAFDAGRQALRAYGIRVTPTVVVLNRKNEVEYVHYGVLGPKEIAKIGRIVRVKPTTPPCTLPGGGCPVAGFEF